MSPQTKDVLLSSYNDSTRFALVWRDIGMIEAAELREEAARQTMQRIVDLENELKDLDGKPRKGDVF